MIEKVMLKEQESVINNLKAKIKVIDELADEILMLQSPESMREVALYLKEIIKQ